MTDENIERAAILLQTDELVAFPTETVYGLGANALSDIAVARIYEAKERPSFNPLIVHVLSSEHASRHVSFSDKALVLAKAFWPGPLTLVLPRAETCALSLLVSAGLDSVAVRAPAHPLARALLQEADIPIAAPSANRSGRVSPTEAAHVREELEGRVAMILDGGPCEVGIESTVVDVTGDIPAILRPGSITEAQLRELVGEVTIGGDKVIKGPGMIESHYAPDNPVRLDAQDAEGNEGLLAFGPYQGQAKIVEQLSEKADLKEAAANLFRLLRKLDASGVSRIAVMPIPMQGLGIAINDRLSRAAAPR